MGQSFAEAAKRSIPLSVLDALHSPSLNGALRPDPFLSPDIDASLCSTMETRVITIAIGGGTCSGKTTLAKQLSRVIPYCPLLNQDHEKNLPMHPVHNVPDPDEAETAIDWPGFRRAFKELLDQGEHKELLFNTIDVGSSSSFGYLTNEYLNQWRERFIRIRKEWLAKGINLEWRMVEGFIDLVKTMDVKVFIRTPGHVMEARREFRVFDNGDGTFWTPPPNYWENIAYPAYIRAHEQYFEDGNVETGKCISPDMVVMEGRSQGHGITFEELFSSAAEAILSKSQPTR
ncbi:ribosylnicotinamide kinase [Ceratobasidium sp. 370]|nr:ribosylnicotinamide kinase [Ceratobasidium sp. 370]